MRRRLSLTSFAVTSMVVLAFLVPLGLLVKDLAHDRALSAAERDAEAIARFIAVVGPSQGVEQALVAIGGDGTSDFETSVILPDGTVIGDPLRSGEDPTTASEGNTVRVGIVGGEVVYVPILRAAGAVIVVRVFVPESVITEGVARSWLTLGVLGVVLIGIAVAVADRLARSIVAPVEELSAIAYDLGDGNLDARVVPAGPREIREVGAEFNRLAEQVEQLLQAERETAADLSHQLRTPLFALRLDAESLPAGPERTRVLDDIDELARHVDFVIREARREVRRHSGIRSDLGAILRSRLSYWEPLAEEQGRSVSADVTTDEVTVGVPTEDIQAMIDAVIENVFAHTAEGAGLAVSLTTQDWFAILEVEDGGAGFADQSLLERGVTGGSGTGLGLDIARRTAESTGGSFQIGKSEDLGGARVTMTLATLA